MPNIMFKSNFYANRTFISKAIFSFVPFLSFDNFIIKLMKKKLVCCWIKISSRIDNKQCSKPKVENLRIYPKLSYSEVLTYHPFLDDHVKFFASF